MPFACGRRENQLGTCAEFISGCCRQSIPFCLSVYRQTNNHYFATQISYIPDLLEILINSQSDYFFSDCSHIYFIIRNKMKLSLPRCKTFQSYVMESQLRNPTFITNIHYHIKPKEFSLALLLFKYN